MFVPARAGRSRRRGQDINSRDVAGRVVRLLECFECEGVPCLVFEKV